MRPKPFIYGTQHYNLAITASGQEQQASKKSKGGLTPTLIMTPALVLNRPVLKVPHQTRNNLTASSKSCRHSSHRVSTYSTRCSGRHKPYGATANMHRALYL